MVRSAQRAGTANVPLIVPSRAAVTTPRVTATDSRDVEDLTSLFKEMKINQQRLNDDVTQAIQTLISRGEIQNMQEEQEFRTFLMTRQRGRPAERGWEPPESRSTSALRAGQRYGSSSGNGPSVSERFQTTCYYCGESGHILRDCEICTHDKYHGLCHQEKDGWVLGRAGVARNPDNYVRLRSYDVAAGVNGGKLYLVVRAYASCFPFLDSWGGYSEWCAAYKKEHQRDFVADLSLVGDHRYLQLPQPAHDSFIPTPGTYAAARVNINRIAVSGKDSPFSVFHYTAAQQLNFFMDRQDGGSALLQRVLPRAMPPQEQISTSVQTGTMGEDPRVVEIPEQDDDETDDDDPDAALTMEQRAAKRARAEVEETDVHIRAPDSEGEPTRRWVPQGTPQILKRSEQPENNHPRRLSVESSPFYVPPKRDQTARAATVEPRTVPATASGPPKSGQEERTDSGTSSTVPVEEALLQLITRSLSVKTPATIEDLIRISPEYKTALVSYIQQLGTGKRVIEHHGSAVQDDQPRHSLPTAAVPTNLKTNFNGTQMRPPPGQTATVVAPAIFGITDDGQWGVAQGSLWEKIAFGLARDQVPEVEAAWMSKPIEALTRSQRMAVGAVTRFHALPTLYCHVDSPQNRKELALLDCGSECNCISLDVARQHGLSLSPTNVISKGLYQSQPFVGETQARIFLGNRSVLCHFFVMEQSAGAHGILLGMPFFKDTSLTFGFEDTRLVAANIMMGDVIIKAFVVSGSTVQRRED
jgi:hypothetical protein